MTRPERLYGDSPWKMIPLPEPVHVEAGKSYHVDFDADGVPFVKEIPSGGVTFPGGGTITSVALFGPDSLARGPALHYYPEET